MSTHAVILAAGKGKRMKSGLPKVLHPVLGVPMVERVARVALSAGVSSITVVVGYGREAVVPLLEENGWNWVVQEKQLGTAHAVRCAAGHTKDADEVLVLMGDVPLLRAETIAKLTKTRREKGAYLAVLTTSPPDVAGYGRVILDGEGRIERIVEEKDANPEERECRVINTGIMVFDGRVLPKILSAIGCENAQHEYYLTDAVSIAGQMGSRAVSVFTPNWREVAGVNNPLQLAACTAVMKRRVVERHLLHGVVIPDPDSVWIEDTVEIEETALIGRNCRLSGNSVIGAGVVLGDGAVVDNTEVESGRFVPAYSVLGAEQ